MARIKNPFVVTGMIEKEYFCDRALESKKIVKSIENGNNLVLISPRRMGKTGLVRYCYDFVLEKDEYYTFFVDILHTTSLKEFTYLLGRKMYCRVQRTSLSRAFVDCSREAEAVALCDSGGGGSGQDYICGIYKKVQTGLRQCQSVRCQATGVQWYRHQAIRQVLHKRAIFRYLDKPYVRQRHLLCQVILGIEWSGALRRYALHAAVAEVILIKAV